MKNKNKVKPAQNKSKSTVKKSPKSVKKKPAPKKSALRPLAKPSSTPKREPVRKIIGKDSVARVVAIQESKSILPSPLEPVTLKKIEAPKVEIQKTARPKIAWNSLPTTLPPRIRFMMSNVFKECAAASAWPFSFAKFIASLPETVCSYDFSLLLMNQDQSEADIAHTCGISVEEVQGSLARIKEEVEELFSSHCSEIFRKWWGSSASAKSLLEPYQIPKVDKDFQLTIAEAVLHSMRRSEVSKQAANN